MSKNALEQRAAQPGHQNAQSGDPEMKRGNHPPSLLAESVRAHALRFETPLAPTYGDAAGNRVLVAFLVIGVGLLFALRLVAGAADVRGVPAANLAFVVALLAAFVVALWPPNMS